MFREHGKLLPSINHIATLCQAVITHGTCDSKRCPGQRQAFIGNGGLAFCNGKPNTLVDGGFRKKLVGDPTFHLDNILQTMRQLSEFLWRTMVDMQHQAGDSTMAPDRLRHLAYANHLCSLLSMDEGVSFEHITLATYIVLRHNMQPIRTYRCHERFGGGIYTNRHPEYVLCDGKPKPKQ